MIVYHHKRNITSSKTFAALPLEFGAYGNNVKSLKYASTLVIETNIPMLISAFGSISQTK